MCRVAQQKGNLMKTVIGATVLAATVALAGCQMTSQEAMVFGPLAGAAAGLITANALNASRDWQIIAALGGAAAGTLVATNNATRTCAYARGDGTFFEAPCP